jgi:hypothetical protein
MKALPFTRHELLLAILKDLRKRVAPNAHRQLLGRCPKSIGYLLRKQLSAHKIKVRLFPRGKGNKGFRRTGLKDVSECAVYTVGHTADQVLNLVGVRDGGEPT